MCVSKCVKEHSKEGNHSAIYQYCTTKGHPLPNIDKYKVIDQKMSQVTKEVIHIHKLDSELNKNLSKMVIPHVLNPLISVKPKTPNVSTSGY